jgi:hypothetical protein
MSTLGVVNLIFHSVQTGSDAHTGLLSHGYLELFSRGLSSKSVELITRLNLAPRSGKLELYLHFSTYLHGTVLN